MAYVVFHKRVNQPYVAFADRGEAGARLAEEIRGDPSVPSLVLGLPRGGIPVADAIARRLNAPLAPVFAKKLPVPDAPEMGFGAVASDGTIELNEGVLTSLGLSHADVDTIAQSSADEIQRQQEAYASVRRSVAVEGRRVYLVDDGLATGQTMIAAAKMVRKMNPTALILCVPVAPESAIGATAPHYDEIHCLIVQEPGRFAVASFYKDFHDLSDEEVLAILTEAKARTGGEQV